MSTNQNREWLMSCGTAGSWSGTLRSIDGLNLGVQKFSEGDQVLSSQNNPSAHNCRHIFVFVARKQLSCIWAYMRKRKSG